jgi:hypothetical protein
MAILKPKPAAKAAPKSGAAKPFGGSGTKAKQNGNISEDDLLKLVPAGLATTVVNARLHDKRVGVAGLQAPGDYEGDWPELPDDISKVSHEDLSNLMSNFQSAYSTAHWQHTKAVIEASVFGDVADFLEERAVLDSDQSNEQKRKAEARTSEAVMAARALEADSRHDARRFGSMVEQLKGNVAVISRIGGFKDDAESSEDTIPSRPASAVGTGKGSGKKILKR